MGLLCERNPDVTGRMLSLGVLDTRHVRPISDAPNKTCRDLSVLREEPCSAYKRVSQLALHGDASLALMCVQKWARRTACGGTWFLVCVLPVRRLTPSVSLELNTALEVHSRVHVCAQATLLCPLGHLILLL